MTARLILGSVIWLAASPYVVALVVKWLQTEEGFVEPLAVWACWSALGFLGSIGLLLNRTLFLRFFSGDYVAIALLSLTADLVFFYAISKMLILPVILSFMLDSVFIACFWHLLVAPALSQRDIISIPFVLGGLFTVTAVTYKNDNCSSICLSTTVDDDVKGLVALIVSRMAVVLRGIATMKVVLKRHGTGQEIPGAATTDETQAFDNRHLFPPTHTLERRLALDRIFGSALFAMNFMGVDMGSTLDLHLIGRHLCSFPVAVVLVYLWPWSNTSAFATAVGKASIVQALAFVGASALIFPLVDVDLSVSTSNVSHIFRRIGATFVALMIASFQFEDEWDRVKFCGAFVLFVGYGMIFMGLHQQWDRQEEEKDILMIAQSQGLAHEEVNELRQAHVQQRNENFRVVLLQKGVVKL